MVQPNASYVNGGMDQLMQFHCFANGKIMCPIKKMPLLSGQKKKNGNEKLYLSPTGPMEK